MEQGTKRPADSTQEQNKRTKSDNANTGGGSGVVNSVKDGYGTGIKKMITKNFFNQAGETVYHITKWSKMFDLNFADDQSPVIIPYHLGGWYGVEWLYGDIIIEICSITRQRLLQNGATNVLTYDFETSQNLVEGWCDRFAANYKISTGNDLLLGNLRYDPTEEKALPQLFDDNTDAISKK